MKKYWFIFIIFIIFLIPYNTFATGQDISSVQIYGSPNLSHTFAGGESAWVITYNSADNIKFASADFRTADITMYKGQKIFFMVMLQVFKTNYGLIPDRITPLGIRGATANGNFTIINTDVKTFNGYYGATGNVYSFGLLYTLELEVLQNCTWNTWNIRFDVDLGQVLTGDMFYMGRPMIWHEKADTTFTQLDSIIQGLASMNNVNVVTAINNQTTDITNAQQGTTNAVEDLNDNLTDSTSNSDSDNQNIINDFNSKLSNNNTISSLITMPITIFQKILNSVNASCTPFTLGNLLGTNITMPCINLANYLGTTLWNVIDFIISGLFIFSISKTMIKVFYNFTSLKDKGDILGGVD